jgi:glycosyltransferase involved in cell wall biosynthesis
MIKAQLLLLDADIFVLPSYAEGLPVLLLEAMAYALPVIVSNVGGIPEVITDEKEGLLISAGNQRQLAESLNRLVNDPVLRDQMGCVARERCQAEFGIDKMVGKLLNLYSRVIDLFPVQP